MKLLTLLLCLFISCNKDELSMGTEERVLGESFAPLAMPVYDHVFIVILENASLYQVWRDSDCDFINSKIIPYGTLFRYLSCYTNAYSQPNYLYFFAGSRCGLTTNATLSGRPLTQSNLRTQLALKNKTFATYAEGISVTDKTKSTNGRYVRKHNPAINFSNVPLSEIRPFPLPTNYSAYPTVTLIIPDLYNSGHDTGEGYADNWLDNVIEPMINYCKVPANNSLFILHFDEGSDSQPYPSKRIATTFVGNRVKVNYVNTTTYSQGQSSLLRTILQMYSAPLIGNTSSYPVMSGWYN